MLHIFKLISVLPCPARVWGSELTTNSKWVYEAGKLLDLSQYIFLLTVHQSSSKLMNSSQTWVWARKVFMSFLTWNNKHLKKEFILQIVYAVMSEAIKPFPTRWSGCRVQVWVQDWAPACHLAISPKAVPEGNQRFRGQNQLPSSWGSSPALLWLVGQARVCYSRCWQRQATLAILTQFKCQKGFIALWISGSSKHFYFQVKWNFQWNWQEVFADQSSTPFALLNLSISHWSDNFGLWVERWLREKTTCSKLNPVWKKVYDLLYLATCNPCIQDCPLQIVQVEYQGQMQNTRILEQTFDWYILLHST